VHAAIERQKELQLTSCDSNLVVSEPATGDALVPHTARVTLLAPERHGVTAPRLRRYGRGAGVVPLVSEFTSMPAFYSPSGDE
jgi:hypothetical protein